MTFAKKIMLRVSSSLKKLKPLRDNGDNNRPKIGRKQKLNEVWCHLKFRSKRFATKR
jgi:hypothetical protein